MLYDVLPDPRAFVAPKSGAVQVLQIHRPLPDTVHIGHFDPGALEVVDEIVGRMAYPDLIQQACARLGDGLEVRFYDHGLGEFDASVLDHLDEIRCLSIDGLATIRQPEAIGRLPKLTVLRFGPWRINDARILGTIGVHRLEHFTLASTPKPAITWPRSATRARCVRSACWDMERTRGQSAVSRRSKTWRYSPRRTSRSNLSMGWPP